MHAAELRQDHFKNGMFRMYTTDTKFFVSREEEPAADLWSFAPGPARSHVRDRLAQLRSPSHAATSFACPTTFSGSTYRCESEDYYRTITKRKTQDYIEQLEFTCWKLA